MTPDEKRVKIAEACGWKRIEQYPEARTDGSDNWIEDYMGSKNGVRTCIPDYFADLNAMHETEKVLTTIQYREFADHLWESARKKARTDRTLECYLSATAAQRAEAFGITLGLWT